MNVFGLTLYDLFLLRGIKHHDWIYRSKKINISKNKLVFKNSMTKEFEDKNLCERLVNAYHKAKKDFTSKDLSNIWNSIIDKKFKQIIKILETGDINTLDKTLSNMFQSEFVYGIAPGSLYKSRKRFGLKIWRLMILDRLVSLAEYLAIVRTEVSEQGVIGYCFNNSTEKILEKIEKKTNISLGFPNIGSPYGLEINNKLLTTESLEHIYCAIRINESIEKHFDNKNVPNILEIGAGFGGTAYWLFQLRNFNIKTYTIIDLPHVNVLQGYFLAKAFGPENVILYGETKHSNSIYSIAVMPTFSISSFKGIDLVINEDSMPEMPENIVEDYIKWITQNVSSGGIFYSYNQEAYSPINNVPQVLVPDVIERIGGLQKMSRNYSWIHPGYVEEVYKMQIS